VGSMLLVILLMLLEPQTPDRAAGQWNIAGWEALRAGRAEEAAHDFREALRLDSSDAIAMLGSGAAAQLRGRTDEAIQQLGGALRLHPSLTAASVLLGELLYRQNDLANAIAVYEQALAYSPAHAQLTTKLDVWRREAEMHGRFSRKLANHFVILFEGPPDQPLAARVAEMLESDYWRIGGALGAYPSDVTTVVLYTKEQFRAITHSPAWAGGMFDGRIRVPVGGTIDERDLRRVIAHELTHAIVQGIAASGVPQWLNEGMAVLFEKGDIIRERAQIAGARLIPLDRLERSFDVLSPAEARLAYAESAVAVQKIIDLGGPTALYNLLTDLANDVGFAEAFERTAFIPYGEFTASLMR
jgi:hypothetical protein